ncbi:piggyBac transposable element-derived protein 4-like [Parambassis ranga]|uniref:PiggyBac transposable element-derived protein 4-like n=1 Tax=Parambassis ranga TaxID=210632 RepID=A0A6P7J6U8_9TELE|nr:piggyBac transposable element-derived protein 4-like [Parambassis ranga]
MPKHTMKTRHVAEERAAKERAARDADVLDEDASHSASFAESAEEDAFVEGEDFLLYNGTSDSDTDWEPDSSLFSAPKGARTADLPHSSSSSSEDVPIPLKDFPRKANGRRRGRRRVNGGSQEEDTPPEERWCGVEVPDIRPPQPIFRPLRVPGSQLLANVKYSALQLFQLFFSNSTLLTIVKNTNEHGRAKQSASTTPWTDITLQDMFSYLSLVIYMGLVKCKSLTDYWRAGGLYSLPFPRSVMSRKKFFLISKALHLNSAADDAANEAKRGTAAFDRMGKIKPLYDEIRLACRQNFQPGQEVTIDERMVASKAHVVFKQYITRKPVHWGFKLYVLADSKTGYTWDFFIYEGKQEAVSGKGLSYDTVMALMNTSVLGSGYKLFVDNYYTSPALFEDLLQKKVWACGTIKPSISGFPKSRYNALEPKASRGSMRWIRKGSLVFVQWRDSRDVFLCSTMHTAHGDEVIKRRTKEDGRWTAKDVPVPPVIKDYNQFMGGVDLSDALIGYYKVLHKTKKWFKTFFFHFVDVAIVNAFILHKDHCKLYLEVPMAQKAFREKLATELAEVGTQRAPQTPTPQPSPQLSPQLSPQPSPQPSGSHSGHHRPVYISGDSTTGRLRCKKCHSKTPVKCSTCDKALCFVAARDCYNDWHDENNL